MHSFVCLQSLVINLFDILNSYNLILVGSALKFMLDLTEYIASVNMLDE